MTNTMNITVDTKNNEVAVFTIEFKKDDFMKVVDAIENVTMENVFNNSLWNVQL